MVALQLLVMLVLVTQAVAEDLVTPADTPVLVAPTAQMAPEVVQVLLVAPVPLVFVAVLIEMVALIVLAVLVAHVGPAPLVPVVAQMVPAFVVIPVVMAAPRKHGDFAAPGAPRWSRRPQSFRRS